MVGDAAGMPEGLLGNTAIHRLYADAVGDGMTELTGGEFVDRLSRLPPLHPPGSVWHYGWGLDLVGLIVESLVGSSLGEFLREEVFAPLDMADTTFGVPSSAGSASRNPFRDTSCPTCRSRVSTPAVRGW